MKKGLAVAGLALALASSLGIGASLAGQEEPLVQEKKAEAEEKKADALDGEEQEEKEQQESAAPLLGSIDITAMVGGWSAAEDVTVTPEQKKLVEKGLKDYAPAKECTYEPVAYLGSQVVAGLNHAVLCREEKKNGYASWVILYLYEDLEGEVSVIGTDEIHLGAYGASEE